MAKVNGKVYPRGIHVIDGVRMQVIDEFSAVALSGPVSEEPAPDTRINVNTAAVDALTALERISEATARRIVESRPFESVEDLTRVKGVTERTLKANDGVITA